MKLAATSLALVAACAVLFAPSVHAFMVTPASQQRPASRLFLEDWVADMIDGELWRQGHKKEFDQEWMEKNRGAVLKKPKSPDNSNDNPYSIMMDDDAREEYRQHARDVKTARSNPQQYCADRCIATGNCDVYEDM